MAIKLSAGVVHAIPADLKKSITSSKAAIAAWEDITPLARNEWICWVEYVKKPETRADHVRRTAKELAEGKRRPCCWIGCPHRTDKSISPSVRSVINRGKIKK